MEVIYLLNIKQWNVYRVLWRAWTSCDIWRVRNPNTKRYTWRRLNPLTQRRLDFFLISSCLQSAITKCEIIPSVGTDHSSIILQVCSDIKENHGPSYWKFNSSLINDSTYVQEMKAYIKTVKEEVTNIRLDPREKWEYIKYHIHKFTISYTKEKSRKFKEQYTILEKEVKEIEATLSGNSSISEIEKYRDLKMKLEQCYDKITEGIIVRSRVQWLEKGEKSSKYFLNLEKRNKNKSCIRKILKEGKEITNSKNILAELYAFYSDRFSRKIDVRIQQCDDFLSNIATLPTLTEEESLLCEGMLKCTDVLSALKSMSDNRSPGNDGFSKAFYLCFFSDLGMELTECLNECYHQGELTVSQRQAVITLIAKQGKDVRHITSWRPISLINVDCKALSKILVTRLSKILNKIIHVDQNAFVPGRLIGDSIRLISDVLDFCEKEQKEGILFGADFSAAFDSVDTIFVFSVLKKFGFGPMFTHWIQILHTNTQSCVLNNGYSTPYFNLKRGCRQGDPIAAYLFLLVTEILSHMVREVKNIEGLKVGTSELKLTVFADDITIFLRNISSFRNLISVLNQFSQYTSLQINMDKSEAVWLGKWKTKWSPQWHVNGLI